MHLEWIIVLPREIKPGDIWRRRSHGKIYGVQRVYLVTPENGGESFYVVVTKQGREFQVRHAELPELVRCRVRCDWPICEFHCGKCMRYRASEERKEHLMGLKPKKKRSRRR
jgi:hypothetical protein